MELREFAPSFHVLSDPRSACLPGHGELGRAAGRKSFRSFFVLLWQNGVGHVLLCKMIHSDDFKRRRMNRALSKRLFVAINLPESVKDYVVTLQNQARSLNLPLRFCDRSNLHLTIVFLGTVEPKLLLEVESKISIVAGASRPFEIVLGTTAILPASTVPKFWYLVARPHPALSRLHDDLVSSFRSVASDLSADREFVPHVSLGRFRRGMVDPAGLTRLLALPTRPLTFLVASLDLMESDLHFQPPRHILLKSFPLVKEHDPLAK